MYQIDKKQFGAFVAELRRETGLTQKQLAEKLFISDKAVSKWETGASIPDTALLIPLAEFLGVTVTELLMCRRMETGKALGGQEVEGIVQAAITFSEEARIKSLRQAGSWVWLYPLALLVGIGCMIFAYIMRVEISSWIVFPILGAIFGLKNIWKRWLPGAGCWRKSERGSGSTAGWNRNKQFLYLLISQVQKTHL